MVEAYCPKPWAELTYKVAPILRYPVPLKLLPDPIGVVLLVKLLTVIVLPFALVKVTSLEGRVIENPLKTCLTLDELFKPSLITNMADEKMLFFV